MKERDTLQVDYSLNPSCECGTESVISPREVRSLEYNKDQARIPVAFSVSTFCDNMRYRVTQPLIPTKPSIKLDAEFQAPLSVSGFLQNMRQHMTQLPVLPTKQVIPDIIVSSTGTATIAVSTPYRKTKRKKTAKSLQQVTHFWMWCNRVMALAIIFASVLAFAPTITTYVQANPEIAHTVKGLSDRAKYDADSLKHKIQNTRNQMSGEADCLNHALKCIATN